MDELWQIGENISNLRRKQGFTQYNLTCLVPFSYEYVKKIEKQGTNKITTLKIFADSLHTAPQFLLPQSWMASNRRNEEDLKDLISFYTPQIQDKQVLLQIVQIMEKHLSKGKLP